jgi:hypothetical protein
MRKPFPSPADRSALLLTRVDELRSVLRLTDPVTLARRVAGCYLVSRPGEGSFHLSLWGREVSLSFPDLIAYDGLNRELNAALQALLIYHFYTSDGTPPAGHFIAFSGLPDGKFYASAFQGYTGDELRRHFGDDRMRFERVAHKHGGLGYPFGDAAFAFRFLPRLALLVVFWAGDDDLSASYQVLFDAAASHHLPTDACAIAGSMLTRQLIATGE